MSNIQRIRDIQVTASKFLELAPDLKITQANSDVVDFYVETAIDKARCAVVVLDSAFVESDKMDEFCLYIVTKHQSAEINGLPIILAVCNSDNRVCADFLLTWDYADCLINENLQLKELNDKTFEFFISEVRKQTHDISVLNLENVRVVKTITLSVDRNGNNCMAEFMYARKLTDAYKMKQFVPQNDQERFDYNLNGPYETEFPNDALDISILEAIKTVYPRAKMRSKLLLCTSEYRSLLRYRKYHKDYAEIRLLPDISKIPNNVLPLLGTVEGLKIRLDIYMTYRYPKNAYCNEGFELRYPFENWLPTLSELSLCLSTFENVSKLIEK